jgi:hypothetical protein
MLEKLKAKGIESYNEAAQELKNMNEELYFYTSRHRVTVKGIHTTTAQGCYILRIPLT